MSLIKPITDTELDLLLRNVDIRKDEGAIASIQLPVMPDPVQPAPEDHPGVQKALHVVLGACLSASVEEDLPDEEGSKAPLDLHTIRALAQLIQRKTGVQYDASRAVI